MTLQPPSDAPRSYALAALDGECEAVTRTGAGRNDQLNRSAFALGQLVGAGALDRVEVERRLFAAAEACGYVKKDGPAAAAATIRSGLDRGEREPRGLPEASTRSTERRPAASNVRALPNRALPIPGAVGLPLPTWTPDASGRPAFTDVGRDEPGRLQGEMRRHAYRRQGRAVRVKVKLGPKNWRDFYRVRRPNDGAMGWQARKPDGWVPVPYVGTPEAFDPFDMECLGEELWWPEGEKDVDSLQAAGLAAFTFGGASDMPDCAELLRDRRVVVLADNDEPGAKAAGRKVDLARRNAASVRLVSFPELGAGEDVSDWLAAGGTREALEHRAAAEPDLLRPTPTLTATPFRWIDPTTIPPRGWVYGWHYIRKFVSCTISPGGIGKSSLAMVEALAIVTGRPLLKVAPAERTAVWYWNGEDPQEELDRRFMAAALHYGLAPFDFEGRLFVDTGRIKPIIVAEQTRDGVKIAVPIVEAVKDAVRTNRIGVLIVDPFVSSHRVIENDNGAIEAVATIWARIADETGCAVELIHHSRKTGGAEVTVEDGRGAVALLNKARSARALNVMTEEEAGKVGVENRRIHFRHYSGKANLAPPSEASTWVKLESRSLDNAGGGRPPDEVGVASSWEWPGVLHDVSLTDLRAVQAKVREGRFRVDPQAKDWVGHVIAGVLGIDVSNKAGRSRVTDILGIWTKNRMFKVVRAPDATRHEKGFVEVDECAS